MSKMANFNENIPEKEKAACIPINVMKMKCCLQSQSYLPPPLPSNASDCRIGISVQHGIVGQRKRAS